MVVAAGQRWSKLLDAAPEFADAFQWIPLGGLERKDSEALLRRKQNGPWKPPLPSDVVEQSLDWCGGHPWLLQHFSESCNGKSKEEVHGGISTCSSPANGIKGNPRLQETICNDYSNLSPQQQAILAALCRFQGDCRRTCCRTYSRRTTRILQCRRLPEELRLLGRGPIPCGSLPTLPGYPPDGSGRYDLGDVARTRARRTIFVS